MKRATLFLFLLIAGSFFFYQATERGNSIDTARADKTQSRDLASTDCYSLPQKEFIGGKCNVGGDCHSGRCRGKVCVASQKDCRTSSFADCRSNSECCSRNCDSGTCARVDRTSDEVFNNISEDCKPDY